MPPPYTSGEAARAAATTRAARRRKPRRQPAKPKRSFQSGEAARGYATARRAAPRKAATFRRAYTAPAPRPTPAQAAARRPSRPYSPPASFRSDAASAGRNPAKKAEAYKKTSDYRRSVRLAYEAQSLAQRRKRIAKIAATPPAKRVREDKIIARDHAVRAQRERQIGLGGDRPQSDIERRVVDAFKETSSYRDDLDAARKARKARTAARAPKTAVPKEFTRAGVVGTGTGVEKALIKAASNAPRDVKDIVVGTPSSLAELGKTAVTKPEKLPGMLAEPYKQLAKDPLKFATENPVSTALMVIPAGRAPGLAAGRAARVAGKQTLRRPDAVMEGTTLRQARTGSRSYGKRRRQQREDEGKTPLRKILKPPRLRHAADTPARAPDHAKALSNRHAVERSKLVTDYANRIRTANRNPQTGLPSGAQATLNRHRALQAEKVQRLAELESRHAAERKQLAPAPKKKAAGKPRQPQITDKEINRRVDEFVDWRQQKRASTAAQAAKAERKKVKLEKLPKAERAQRIEERVSGAVGQSHKHAEREFAGEFGSHWRVGKGGKVRRGTGREGGGHIHASKATAEQIAKEVPFDARVVRLDGETEGVTAGYAVLPKSAAERFASHKRVGTGGFAGGPILRVSGRQFRRAVLPYSLKWLLGQVTEAGIRAGAQGAGPTALIRYRKLMKELERVDPKAASALRKRGVSGGAFGSTGAIGADLITDVSKPRGTFAAEFPESKTAAAVTKLGTKPIIGMRGLRKINRATTDVVFNQVNGRVEHLAKAAMLGKAVKQGPLMERRTLGLSKKAIEEAAQGLRGTSTQVELARAVDRAYGRYSKFSPKGRDMILHTTPFFPWFKNMAEFNFKVLPKDHPLKAALVADLAVATEERRKKQRLSYKSKERVPDWMMGATPGKHKDKFHPLARYGPFVPGDYASALGSQFLPQVTGIQQPLAPGVTFTGEQIKGGQEKLIANALLGGAEALIPGVGPVSRITGLGEHYVRGKTKKPSIVQGKSVLQGAREVWDPTMEIGKPGGGKKKKKKAKKKTGLSSGDLNRGGLRGGGLR